MMECKIQGGFIRINNDDTFTLKVLWSKKTYNFSDIKDLKWVSPSETKDYKGQLLIAVDKLHILWFEASVESSMKEIFDYLSRHSDLDIAVPAPVVFDVSKKIGDIIEIDEKNKKIAFLLKGIVAGQSRRIVDFKDILDFEILEDNESVIKGGLGRAIVGGALFGGVGAITGGVTGKRQTKQIVQRLELIIRLNTLDNPTINFVLIKNPVKKTSLTYQLNAKLAQDAISALNFVVNNKTEEVSPNIPSAQPTSAADEILKFKQLLDAGIITQEEFDAKKKQLLNL